MNDNLSQITKLLSLIASIGMGAMIIKSGDTMTGVGVITAALSSTSAISKSQGQ